MLKMSFAALAIVAITSFAVVPAVVAEPEMKGNPCAANGMMKGMDEKMEGMGNPCAMKGMDEKMEGMDKKMKGMGNPCAGQGY